MRTATVRISPRDEGLHPADAAVAAHSDVRREAIEHITSLADGTAVVLTRLRGDPDAVEAALGSATGVVDHHVAVADGTVHAYLHFEPTETSEALLQLRRDHEVIVPMPITWVADGRLEVTALGDDPTLQRAIDGIPEGVGVQLVEIGEYEPDSERPESLLTDRQLEVLDAALAVGYYEEPRRGTQADVADEVGLAAATVGEHLRRIEGKVLRALRE